MDILLSLNAPQGTVTTGENAAYKGAADQRLELAEIAVPIFAAGWTKYPVPVSDSAPKGRNVSSISSACNMVIADTPAAASPPIKYEYRSP